jgi:hypothetical protein
MMLVLENDAIPYKEDAPMTIITTKEDGQTRASVVLYYSNEDQKMVGPQLEGSLADSDSEALLSLYEDSKDWTAKANAELQDKRLWR